MYVAGLRALLGTMSLARIKSGFVGKDLDLSTHASPSFPRVSASHQQINHSISVPQHSAYVLYQRPMGKIDNDENSCIGRAGSVSCAAAS